MSQFEYANDNFWTRRTPFAGRTPAYNSPEEMYQAALEAFEWFTTHPLREQIVFHNKGQVVKTYVTKMRPFTKKGISMCMGLSESGLFEVYARRAEYAELVAWICDVIHTQKFEGAAVGLLNANFIARDLGMADRAEVTGKDGGPLTTQDVTDKEKLRDEARRLGIPLEALGLSGGDEEEN